MARYVPKTYNNRRMFRIIFRAVVAVSLAVLVLFIVLFFWLQSYIVYSPIDGTLRLEIPWLADYQESSDMQR